MLLTLIFLTVALALLAASASEGLALAIAGVVAPILAQIIKRFADASGSAALVVTVVVSALVALGAMWFVGEIHSFGDVVKQVGTVFAVATVVYKFFLAPTPAK